MTGRLLAPVRRIAAMDAEELKFRLRGEALTTFDRLRRRVSPARWDRRVFARLLAPGGPADFPHVAAARRAADAEEWQEAHLALARHFTERTGAFPLHPAQLETLTAAIAARFPAAAAESAGRADRMLAGRYDLLGYRDLEFGRPTRWHLDPVHGRTAPGGFWAHVPYLDPSSGDHKVIWEINRHQHWVSLARARQLTGDVRYEREIVQQLEGWLAANPPLEGVNWASMLELAFRSLSWLWTLHLLTPLAARHAGSPAAEQPWIVDLLVGLDRQLTHIARNLSRYFSPNTHLSGEALALYVAGASLPELHRSRWWMSLGRDVLIQEATRQVRADGGHAELSPHYHRYSTDFYLLALQVARGAGDPAASRFEEAARRQSRYLRTIADGSGRIPRIGDDDGGQLFPVCGRDPSDVRDTLAVAAILLDEPALAIGAVPEEAYWRCGLHAAALSAAGEEDAWPSAALKDSGYVVSRNARGDHLVLDAGRHGFLNGGHAHADALSLVATVGGRPFLVDPGTGTYTMDATIRDRFRSAEMHNTVVLDGRGPSVPRGPFHWHRTTDAVLSLWRDGDGVEYAEARHHGYGAIGHVRVLIAVHDGAWIVIDHFLGSADAVVSADHFWHLDPAWTLVSGPGPTVLLQHRSGRMQSLASTIPLASVRGTRFEPLAAMAPAYGRIEPAECLRGSTSGPLPRSVVTVIPMAAGSGLELSVDSVPLTEPVPGGWHAAGARVRLGRTEVLALSAVEGDGVPRTDLAAPAERWGSADLQLVGRAAVLVSGPDVRAALVNGRHLAAGPLQLNHDLSRPFITSTGGRSQVPAPPAAQRDGGDGGFLNLS